MQVTEHSRDASHPRRDAIAEPARAISDYTAKQREAAQRAECGDHIDNIDGAYQVAPMSADRGADTRPHGTCVISRGVQRH